MENSAKIEELGFPIQDLYTSYKLFASREKTIVGPYNAVYTPRNDVNKNDPSLEIDMGPIVVHVITCLPKSADQGLIQWSDDKCVIAYRKQTRHPVAVPDWLFMHRPTIDEVFEFLQDM